MKLNADQMHTDDRQQDRFVISGDKTVRLDPPVIDLREPVVEGAPRASMAREPEDAVPGGSSGFKPPRRWRLIARVMDLFMVVTVWAAVFAGSGRPSLDVLLVLGVMIGIAALRLGAAKRQTMSIGKARTFETAELGAVSFEVAVGLLAVAAVTPLDVGLSEVTLTCGLLLLGWPVGRRVTWSVARRLARSWTTPQRVVLIGDDNEAMRLHRLMSEHPELALHVVGRIGHPLDYHAGLSGLRWLGTMQYADQLVKDVGASSVVIASTALAAEDIQRLVRSLQSTKVEIHISAGLQGISRGSVRLSTLALGAIIQIRSDPRPRWQSAVKRIIDFSLAIIVLLVTLPVFALTALILRLGDDGPVIFRQQRVGKDGELFTLLKFRSMVCDAEDRLAGLRADNEREGPLFKMHDDPRVTPFGRFIRASSIDELPQLWNVIGGEMSLVGPRPALPSEASSFEGRLSDRSLVTPGITGLWQVESRDNPSFFNYERLDLFYVDNWTIRLDLAILFTTVPVVMVRGVRSVLNAAKRQPDAEASVVPSPSAMVGPEASAAGGPC